jgi:hypothetical protein
VWGQKREKNIQKHPTKLITFFTILEEKNKKIKNKKHKK